MYVSAIAEATAEEMERDERVFIMGQGVEGGGSFKSALGLLERFGPERVRDTPISEDSVVGCAVGAAITGWRPIVQILFCDFTLRAMDQIGNQAAKYLYMTGGQMSVPLVIRTSIGIGANRAAQHSQSLEPMFQHFPGLKIALPSTPYDVKGLLKSAVRDDNPVIFIESFALYGTKGIVPEEEYTIPLGEADIKREGKDITIVAVSAMVPEALRAAEDLEREGIDAEVLDPRTLVPLDLPGIVRSIQKTNRLLVVEAGPKRGGVGAEIVSSVMEEAFDYLDSPPARLAVPNTPIPSAPQMEAFVLPNSASIAREVRRMLE
ncbi:MAG: alpha-ketoacid dehydrogenase subunit beta [Deltaproteobacteria bacterium]|nr:alpha-ketoacid dehydrogenase subunit beta [Deltaproteobacteria bacterium]MBW2307601.1 alpha-ketoacid dehydrogenase subunit beta [Deltaproteobacteria bacterium]